MEEKILKLTNAVYKVLEFFPEADPLKNRAKDRALEIMQNFLEAAPQGEPRPIGRDIDILLGYLWIGKSQGWLNSANCLIITNEYEKLKKEIELKVEPKARPDSVLENTGAIKEGAPVIFNISDRQKKIVEFLQKNEKAQVMDLQTILPDVTKRTIRRDLDELLELGKIDRMGEFNEVFYRIKGPA